NWSGHKIPNKVQMLLQLGDKFSLPPLHQKSMLFDFIKNIENNFWKLRYTNTLKIRNLVVPILRKFLSTSVNKFIKDELFSLVKCTSQFMKNNSNIIFTRVDKGNITVALDRNDYINKVTQMLEDPETYTRLKKNPLNGLERSIRELIKSWKKRKYISDQVYKKVSFSDGILPRCYALPKVHKPGNTNRRYLNYLSAHPVAHKKGIVMGMTDRAILLSNPKYHKKNIQFIINTLLKNDYSVDFIFKTINIRLKYLFSGRNPLTTEVTIYQTSRKLSTRIAEHRINI
ncbi:hypothetical protein ALC60_07594, partial [Trachymyrmex zeteki]